MPGVPRPLSRELPTIKPPPSTDRPGRESMRSTRRSPSPTEALTDGEDAASTAPAVLPAIGQTGLGCREAAPGRLPERWALLCTAREERVEQLLNLALRLQAYMRGSETRGKVPPNVRHAVAEGLGALRSASLTIVEELLAWQAATEQTQAALTEHQAQLEKRRRKLIRKQREEQRKRDEAAQRAAKAAMAERQGTIMANIMTTGMGGEKDEDDYQGIQPKQAAATSAGLYRLRPDLDPGARQHTNIFSAYALRFVTSPPGELVRAREGAGLWDGLNYLLKMMTDVWRLPLPCATDPFFLRWFDGDGAEIFGGEATNGIDEVTRMMAAETALKRLLRSKHYKAMDALEISLSLKMDFHRPLPTADPARLADTNNWKVLAGVLYEEEATSGFTRLKRVQWQSDRAAARVQMMYRKRAVVRRVRKRIYAKQEAAARVVQYYYKHKLRLTSVGQRLVLAAQEQLAIEREAQARERARRRHEELLRLSEKEREDRRARALNALRSALREYAATDFIQRVVRGALARFGRRKLRLKQSAFLRTFSNETTGFALKAIVKFQRRVRLWLAQNDMFHTLYEEHRHFLLMQRTQEPYDALEAFLSTAEARVAEALAATADAVKETRNLPAEASLAQQRLHRARGELEGLRGEPSEAYTLPRSVTDAKQRVAQTTGELENEARALDDKAREWGVHVAAEAKCTSAASATLAIEAAHRITMPLLLGQHLILTQGVAAAAGEAAAAEAAMEASWKLQHSLTSRLAQCEAVARPGEGAAREERADKIAGRMPQLREEAEASMAKLGEWREALKAHAALAGEQHVLGLLRQRCQWRRWGKARMERITALTVLRGTRSAAKRARQLETKIAEANGAESLVEGLSVHTSSPPCHITLRPMGLGNLPSTTTIESFNRDVAETFVADLAQALQVDESRLILSRQGLDASSPPLDEGLGLELLAAAGACDQRLTIVHEPGGTEDENEMPEALLLLLSNNLPFGEYPLRRTLKALHVQPGRSLEFKVLATEVPELERISVRRVLAEKMDGMKETTVEAKRVLAEAAAEKKRAQADLAPGDLGPRTKDLKLALVRAQGAMKACQELLNELPERDSGEEQMLQFDWLPSALADVRASISKTRDEPLNELRKLRPSVDAREVGKQTLANASKTMAELTTAPLPECDPPLENAGKIIMEPLHGTYYQHRELLYGRRQLACNLSKYAAEFAYKTAQRLKGEEATGRISPHGAKGGMGGGGRGPSMGGGKGKGGPMGGPMGGKGGGRVSPHAKQTGPSIEVLEQGGSLSRVRAVMLLTPSPELSCNENAITPDRVLEMCATLGIAVAAGGEPEYFMLWIAIEALACPLPPLWRRMEREEELAEGEPSKFEGTTEQNEARYYYEHSVTGERCEEHPLLAVYREAVVAERGRKGKARAWSSVEQWVLFAGDNDDAIFFYNFASRQRSRELPGELIAAYRAKQAKAAAADVRQRQMRKSAALSNGGRKVPPPRPPPTSQEMATMRKNIAMGRPQREGLDTPRPGTAPEPQPVGRYEAKQLTARTAANSRLTRHASLQLRPRPLPEILVAAAALKVNLICHSQLLWLVDSVLGCDYLPVAWTKVEKRMWGSMQHGSKEMNKLTSTERLRFASHGDVPRYSNTLIRLTSELNPMASAVKDTTDILT